MVQEKGRIEMRLVILNGKLEGEMLGSSIYTEDGVMFLKKGSMLRESAIKRLSKMGINTVYIDDGNSKITLQEVIPTTIKLGLVKSLKSVFEEIKRKKEVDYSEVYRIINELIENINLSENAVIINNLAPRDDIARLTGHSIDVAILSLIVGSKRKYNEKKLMDLGIGALLHDIGKLFVQGKEHVEVGYKLLKSNTRFSPISYMCVYELYEKKNGTGPLGMSGDKIFELSKIVSICNLYMKYLSDEKGMLPHEVMEKIAAETVSSYDEDVYRDFANSVYCYPNGLPVRLSNGLEGVVIAQNKDASTRPVVQVREDNKYNFYNLLQNLTLFIEEVIL